ncbi:MAG: CPBP family intramembrane metalloprotease [Phycisphaerales bacterium]|nr:CPBP family intramembrane metalloprotease [Phycisphaerales bacterium]
MKIRFSPVVACLVGVGVFIACREVTGLGCRACGIDGGAWPAAMFKALLALVALAVVGVDAYVLRGRTAAQYGWRWPRAHWLDYVLAIALGGAAGVAGALLVVLTPAKGMGSVGGMGSLLQIILGVWLWSSITEEIFARSMVQSWMDDHRRRMVNLGIGKLSRPVIASGLFFGALHLSIIQADVDALTVVFVVMFTTATGLVAAYYREKTESLLLPVLAHIAANVGGMIGGIIGMTIRMILT